MHPEAGLADVKKSKVPVFEIGDTVDVHVKIREGEKERIQVFTGTVIARRGAGLSASFTVRRVVQGHGVERVFPLHAPTVSAVKVKRHGKTRRAKLYFLRDRVGKAVRLRERLKSKVAEAAKAEAAAEKAAAEKAEAEAAAKAEAEAKAAAEAEAKAKAEEEAAKAAAEKAEAEGAAEGDAPAEEAKSDESAESAEASAKADDADAEASEEKPAETPAE
jgi:large subunit ribosomal protein L19